MFTINYEWYIDIYFTSVAFCASKTFVSFKTLIQSWHGSSAKVTNAENDENKANIIKYLNIFFFIFYLTIFKFSIKSNNDNKYIYISCEIL